MTTKTISNNILNIHNTLASFSSFIPSTSVDITFSRLVSLVINTPDVLANQILSCPTIATIVPELQSYSSVGETALEEHWAKNFCELEKLNMDDLSQFPYFANYCALAKLEIAFLSEHHLLHTPLLFVGGGPLPLSAILYAVDHGLPVHIIDNNEEAVRLSSLLISKLGLQDLVTVTCVDIMSYTPAEKTIFLAAMVGKNQNEKENILEHIASVTSHDTTLISRSVEGLGELLYPKKPISPHYKDIAIYRGTRDIINTVVISKKI